MLLQPLAQLVMLLPMTHWSKRSPEFPIDGRQIWLRRCDCDEWIEGSTLFRLQAKETFA
jgi:hypothetical protein